MIIKRHVVLMIILIASFSMGLYFILYLLPANAQKRSQFEITHTQEEYDQAAIDGVHSALGFPPSILEKGIAHFTLKNLSGVQFHIPREHLDLMPTEPDGETDMISMTFYLPKMDSTSKLLKNKTYDQNLEFQIRVSLSTKANYIHCWGAQCLDQAFALFQSDVDDFQNDIAQAKKQTQLAPITTYNMANMIHHVTSLSIKIS